MSTIRKSIKGKKGGIKLKKKKTFTTRRTKQPIDEEDESVFSEISYEQMKPYFLRNNRERLLAREITRSLSNPQRLLEFITDVHSERGDEGGFASPRSFYRDEAVKHPDLLTDAVSKLDMDQTMKLLAVTPRNEHILRPMLILRAIEHDSEFIAKEFTKGDPDGLVLDATNMQTRMDYTFRPQIFNSDTYEIDFRGSGQIWKYYLAQQLLNLEPFGVSGDEDMGYDNFSVVMDKEKYTEIQNNLSEFAIDMSATRLSKDDMLALAEQHARSEEFNDKDDSIEYLDKFSRDVDGVFNRPLFLKHAVDFAPYYAQTPRLMKTIINIADTVDQREDMYEEIKDLIAESKIEHQPFSDLIFGLIKEEIVPYPKKFAMIDEEIIRLGNIDVQEGEEYISRNLVSSAEVKKENLMQDFLTDDDLTYNLREDVLQTQIDNGIKTASMTSDEDEQWAIYDKLRKPITRKGKLITRFLRDENFDLDKRIAKAMESVAEFSDYRNLHDNVEYPANNEKNNINNELWKLQRAINVRTRVRSQEAYQSVIQQGDRAFVINAPEDISNADIRKIRNIIADYSPNRNITKRPKKSSDKEHKWLVELGSDMSEKQFTELLINLEFRVGENKIEILSYEA